LTDTSTDTSTDGEAPLEIVPYVLSGRARLQPPQRRLPLPGAVAHRLWARSSWPRMDRWLGRPDVVHGTNYVVPPMSCPRLVSVYDCWFLRPDVDPQSINPDVRRSGQVLRRAVSEGAHVCTSSLATTEAIGELLDVEATRVHTIHLGPPPPACPPPERRRLRPEPYILALGTVERRKSITTLVDAFAILAADHRDLGLVVAGRDGDDAARLERRIASLDDHARSRVTRLRDVDEPTKAALLADAHVLAYPSIDEGFGFPLLEAQQAGVPVVASRAGSIPEVAGSGAALATPGDADDLAATIGRVVASDAAGRQLRADLVESGRHNVQRFSWSSTARRLRSLYRQLIEQER
jgi:glycosyltransferase involved in cell wall biosynthesis